jgi:hypothetical protein
VKLTRRFSEGISLTTNYTWSKSIDNSSGTRTQGLDILFPQDSRCLECERSLSSFDVRHRWVLGAVYELPVGKDKMLAINSSVLNGLVGGWQLSANTTIQSGVPQTLSAGGNIAGTNNPVNDRPAIRAWATDTSRIPSAPPPDWHGTTEVPSSCNHKEISAM